MDELRIVKIEINDLREELKKIKEELDFLKKENDVNRIVKFKKLNPDAITPKYQKEGDAGFDFYALIDNNLKYLIVEPKNQIIIKTGISCSIPEGYEIQVRPRSGLAFKYKITVTNSPGTIDSGYKIPNEIMIIIYNLGEDNFKINNGDRIAQGVLAKVEKVVFEEVFEIRDEDKIKNRGGGFGSTGIS